MEHKSVYVQLGGHQTPSVRTLGHTFFRYSVAASHISADLGAVSRAWGLTELPFWGPLQCLRRSQTIQLKQSFSFCCDCILQGEDGDRFYIVKEGKASVTQINKEGKIAEVNLLFKADYFGEQALLNKVAR